MWTPTRGYTKFVVRDEVVELSDAPTTDPDRIPQPADSVIDKPSQLSRSTSDEEIEVFLHLLPLCKYEAVSKKQKINSHSTLVDFCNGILYYNSFKEIRPTAELYIVAM